MTTCASLLHTREPGVRPNPVGLSCASQAVSTISGNSGVESLDSISLSARSARDRLWRVSLEIPRHAESPSPAEGTPGDTSDIVSLILF